MSDLTLHQYDNLGLKEGDCKDIPSIGAQSETGQETPEGLVVDVSKASTIIEDNPEVSIDSDIPAMKRYAHHGKRRRAYTEELFRCQLTDMISRTPLVCNHLLWKNKPEQLRDHLLEHLKVSEVMDLTDSQVLERYTNAKKIYLEGVTDDESEEGETDE